MSPSPNPRRVASRDDLRGDLPEDYYLTNFRALTGFVERTYGEFLNVAERDWLDAFESCTEPARRLYVRLLGRRGSIFRIGRLRYVEIADIVAAAEELAGRGLVDTAPPATLAELVPTFTKPELLSLLDLGHLARLSRPELVARIREAEDDVTEARRVRERLAAADRWVTVRGHTHFTLFSLCFFGNLHQDTTEFVLSDLGAVRYEPYPIGPDARAFGSRAQIEAHLRFFECEWLHEHVDARDADALLALVVALPARPAEDPLLCRRLDRLRNRVARQLERLGRGDDALAVYAASERPPSRERRVRILVAAGREDEAEALCRTIAVAPLGESESQFVERTLAKLARAAGRQVAPVKAFRPLTTRLALRRGEGRVEQVAREFYARRGECHYVENSLVTGMLGLFAWDIVFLPLPGAFFHPFQSGPSDFREPGFRVAREHAFAERLAELDVPGQLAGRVLDTWRSRRGVANPLVHWSRLSEALLQRAIERVPTAHWRVLFERVLDDTRENTTGLPDLVRFPDEGGYELVEIKGPGDALQANQRRWMRHFAAHGIPCRVVNVCWATATSAS